MGRWHILYQNPQTARRSNDFPDITPPGSSAIVKDTRTPAERLFESLRREVRDPRVIAVMERVPRELFVPPGTRHLAYDDEALPIAEGQTISQPLIVALMTSALHLTGTEKVLEVGTGSGYQAAVLSQLARHIVTVERKPKLAETARARLASLGIHNVTVRPASGEIGWRDEAPYDAIIVTAAAPRIPKILLAQLREGGRIVIPVGTRSEQELLVATKRGDRVELERLGGCRFVPLIGNEAFDEEPAG
ncbi:MAG: protein-L-isoaspartate(D-aspartate) O-methyltransferase [Chloroflexi bacterium]|nr:protein-L-isoaspartate(D-aspartate) O-methyltransferase [Chloroflexota bacterium]